MDSYLILAKRVLRQIRQPLSAREILKVAYQTQIVPAGLYGRTQHKTLQARLSTDILKWRLRSEFYRTGPGRFFLRALQNDSSTPEKYRREYVAPIRAAQLGRFEVLTVARAEIEDLASRRSPQLMLSELGRIQWRYVLLETVRRDSASLPLQLVVVPINNGFGLRREGPPALKDESRASLGVSDFIRLSDWSLFSEDEIGLFDAVFRTVAENLSIPIDALDHAKPIRSYEDTVVLYEKGAADEKGDLLVIIELDCSECPAVLNVAATTDYWQWKRLGGPLDV